MKKELTKQNLIKNISQSKKYKDVYEKTIERIVDSCWGKYDNKTIETKIRNLLHQIWGAYWTTRPNFKKLLEKIEQDIKLKKTPKETILPILKIQSSVEERISILDQFYQKIFSITGIPNTIIEHACGFNPLTFFWMDLPKKTKYIAYDIDKEEINFINEVFKKIKCSQNMSAQLGDVLSDKFDYADVVFMLKLLPCLERQQKGSALEAMKNQQCKYLVISYPIKSLTGVEKGMTEFYTKQFENLVKNENWHYQKILFDTELVFVIQK